MRYIRGFLIKKAPILWLRNRTTENRKGKKARNIKEKRQSKNFSTVSKQLVALRSSPRDNYFLADKTVYAVRRKNILNSIYDSSGLRFWGVFYLSLISSSGLLIKGRECIKVNKTWCEIVDKNV